ncbi:MAG: hypothetical protein CMH55_09170 [Myxococcales bacterium]|nr:hypothetical protein [Myxococcales bacterium]
MNVLSLCALALLAAPDEPPAAPEQSPAQEGEAAETAGLDVGPAPSAALGPFAVGLVLGEPTALRGDFYLDEQTRAFGLLGTAHRIDAFSFAFDAPMLAVGAERDVFVLDNMGTRSGAVAVGFQADFWMRSFYTSSKPMLALEVPISFRLASPTEPLSFYGTVAPGYYVAPGAGPSLSLSVGLSFRLPKPGPRAPAAAEPPVEAEAKAAAEPAPEAKPDPAPKPAAKPKPKPKGRRRLSR